MRYKDTMVSKRLNCIDMSCFICEINTTTFNLNKGSKTPQNYGYIPCSNGHGACVNCLRSRWNISITDVDDEDMPTPPPYMLVLPCPHPDCQCATFHPILLHMISMEGYNGNRKEMNSVHVVLPDEVCAQYTDPILDELQIAFEAYDALRAIRILEDREKKGKQYSEMDAYLQDSEWYWAMHHDPIPKPVEVYEANLAYLDRYESLEEAKSDLARRVFEKETYYFHHWMPLFRTRLLTAFGQDSSLLEMATCGYRRIDRNGKNVDGNRGGFHLELNLTPTSLYARSTQIDHSLIYYLFTGEALVFERLLSEEYKYQDYFHDAQRKIHEEEDRERDRLEAIYAERDPDGYGLRW
jgi:hypothetical protein